MRKSSSLRISLTFFFNILLCSKQVLFSCLLRYDIFVGAVQFPTSSVVFFRTRQTQFNSDAQCLWGQPLYADLHWGHVPSTIMLTFIVVRGISTDLEMFLYPSSDFHKLFEDLLGVFFCPQGLVFGWDTDSPALGSFCNLQSLKHIHCPPQTFIIWLVICKRNWAATLI